MIGPSFRIVLVAFCWVGLVPLQDARAQDDMPEDTRPWVLVPKSARRVKLGLSIEVRAPNFLADEWSIFFTQLPELPGQAEVKMALFPRAKSARDLSEEARPLLYAQIPAIGQQYRKDVKARAEYEATLLERRLERKEAGDPDPPPVAPLDARTRRMLLANSHQFDYNTPKFRAWLEENKLRRVAGESEIDFARKAFLAVRHGLKIDEAEDLEHLASHVVQAGQSDATGIIVAYVAALRANGIATRVLAGRMVVVNNQPSRKALPHAQVEFYAPTVGWIPADPASAIGSGRKTEGLEFFGNDTGGFLAVHLDTDIVVDTYIGPQTHEWLQNPVWYVSGGGGLDGCKTKVEFTVESEPLELTEVVTRLNARASSTSASKKSTAKTSKKAR